MNHQRFTGRAASPGTAIGVLHRTDRPQPTALPWNVIGNPVTQITETFQHVAADLLSTSERLRADGRGEDADILEVISYLAMDTDLRALAVQHAKNGLPLALAVQRAVDHHAEALAALSDPTLAERAADVRQVGKRVIARLHGHDDGHETDGPVVLMANEIGAADLLEPAAAVAAAVSVTGGFNSHAAIVARSLGIPLLIGVHPAVLDLVDGEPVTVDGEHGKIIVNPSTTEQAAAGVAMRVARQRREALAAERHLPAQTRDGHTVALRANIATTVEARAAITSNADGVGLLRTELPFLNAVEWPSEAQHRSVLSPVLRAMAGQPVTVRTLDYADDKLPPFLSKGGSGRLGRGLPLMLGEPDAFARQFRAVLATGGGCDVRIMIPMVATPGELDECRHILNRVAHDLGVVPPPLGAMIELSEAVAAADDIAARADFLSIGSNDLTGHLLGLNRRDPALTPQLAAHPVVLRAIAGTIAAAHRHHQRVSICGDAAAHPLVVPLLIGLDCDVLSMAPAHLDQVRATIRRLDHTTCATIAHHALTLTTAEQVWDVVREHCSPRLP
ncbi:MAG: multiphosphoryl transfer protein [Pseudonocardiales bacterium]|jgi:phosphoenolpyruvate-protein kinase (PTS system EI component)|nr:multiphosphoryl transfer protein [Pseudonocardiales bacterium]